MLLLPPSICLFRLQQFSPKQRTKGQSVGNIRLLCEDCRALSLHLSSDMHPLPCVQVLLSSAVFSATHFSARDFPALLLLGCCLGIATVADEGNLAAPLGAHVLYNGLLLAGLAANSR